MVDLRKVKVGGWVESLVQRHRVAEDRRILPEANLMCPDSMRRLGTPGRTNLKEIFNLDQKLGARMAVPIK
jgi:hypothetical protein